MRKITIVKVLSSDQSVSQEELIRYKEEVASNPDFLEEAAKNKEIEYQTFGQDIEGTLTLVKVGDENYPPSVEELNVWRDLFDQAKKDPDFTIFTHQHVNIEVINLGKIISVK